MAKRINRAIELLEADQAIYYDGPHTGHVLTYEQGLKDAKTDGDKERFEGALQALPKATARLDGGGKNRAAHSKTPRRPGRCRLDEAIEVVDLYGRFAAFAPLRGGRPPAPPTYNFWADIPCRYSSAESWSRIALAAGLSCPLCLTAS